MDDDEGAVGGDRVELGAGDIAFFGERFLIELPDGYPAAGLGWAARNMAPDSRLNAWNVGDRAVRLVAQVEAARAHRRDGEVRMRVDKAGEQRRALQVADGGVFTSSFARSFLGTDESDATIAGHDRLNCLRFVAVHRDDWPAAIERRAILCAHGRGDGQKQRGDACRYFHMSLPDAHGGGRAGLRSSLSMQPIEVASAAQ